MTIKLRKHQERCINDCIEWIKKSVEPAVVEATVSFGKSIVIADLARRVRDLSKKKVLILCPNGTLVKQNSSKVREIGEPCSVFSASAGEKSTRHDIVVGTPQTIVNSLSRFGERFSAILIDEGDSLTGAIRSICEKIQKENPLVRIIGFTGTPWTTKNGYVYRVDLDGTTLGETQSVDPFYLKCIHKTRTDEMMEDGYLTPMVIGEVMAEKYHTSTLKVNGAGRFNSSDLDKAYHGHGRVTSAICADIVAQSRNKMGVMIFAATIPHVKEVYASMPPELTRMVYGGNPENAKNISDFKAGKVKYIVNMDILTVGFDASHVDVIAILRKTESKRLYTQIAGRGVRLHEDNWIDEPITPELRKAAIANGMKPFCLLLDYTEDNMSLHFPDGDLWNPKIEARVSSGEQGVISCPCPDCGTVNEYALRPNKEGYEVSPLGFFCDLEGNEIKVGEQSFPAHYGRRCYGMHPSTMGTYEQCSYRYASKDCPHCMHDNDIAARYCIKCKGEIVNVGDKLRAEFRSMVRSPHNRQCNTIEEIDWNDSVTQSGKECIRVNIKTPYRRFTIWVMKSPVNNLQQYQLDMWLALRGTKPQTVEYMKDPKTNFYRIYSWNKPADEEPE